MSSIRVVVTGANGFIGLHTVEALLTKGYEVLALDVYTDRLGEKFSSPCWNMEIKIVSILGPNLQKLIKRGDKVLHLAAVSHFETAESNPRDALKVNVEGTINLLSAIRDKAERIVFASSGSVYSRSALAPIKEIEPCGPESSYGISKKQAEEWIRYFSITEPKLPFVILRYGYVYGPGKTWGAIGNWIEKIRKKERPVIFGGNQTNDFINVHDVVQANLLALETDYPNEIYNIGTGRATSIKEACRTVIHEFGSDLEPIFKPPRKYDIPIFVYDITKAKILLDYVPLIDFRGGIGMLREAMAVESKSKGN